MAGSGCDSRFRRDESGVIHGGFQSRILKLTKGKAHVLVVEKPGVKLYESSTHPGEAYDCSQEFLREHTLDRWTDALKATVRESFKNSKVDSSKVLAIGHSEGTISIARLSAKEPILLTLRSFQATDLLKFSTSQCLLEKIKKLNLSRKLKSLWTTSLSSGRKSRRIQ